MYEIRKYQEVFLDDQVSIGSSIYNKWRMGGQTRKAQLKQVYSSDNFDPGTRLYGFREDIMQGFITGAMRDDGTAFFEWPYVLPGNNGLEQELIDALMDALRNRGAKKLITRAGKYWGRTEELALRYKFDRSEDLVRRGEIHSFRNSLMKLDHSTRPVCEVDKASLFEFYTKRGQDERRAQMMAGIPTDLGKILLNPWNIKYFWSANILKEDGGEVVGHAAALHNLTYEPSESVLVRLEGESPEVERELLAGLLHEIRKFGDDVLLVHTGQWGFPDESKFNEYIPVFIPVLSYWELPFA